MAKCYKRLVHSSRPTQTNSYIIIHNSAGGTAEGVYSTFIDNKNKGSNICAHYAVDDKNVIQLLEDNWNGQHTNGRGYYKGWNKTSSPGKKADGVNNSNSIGIEVADGNMVNQNTANDNCIELVRYLMKQYKIPINNVIRHGDTQDKDCPHTIMAGDKWKDILSTIKSRNDANEAIKLDVSGFSKTNMTANGSLDNNNDDSTTSSSGTSDGQVIVKLVFANDGNTTVQESLPNANTSDNWVDMHKIKGITLHMYPPYQMCCDVEHMEQSFKKLDWDRAYHYKVDYKTKVDYSKKVPLVSGPGTGGNTIGSSLSDFVLIPGEGVYSGGVITIPGGGGTSGTSTDTDSSNSNNSDFTGNSKEEVAFNYYKGKGCSTQATCGILGNAKAESNFSVTDVNPSSGATGVFQWLGTRLANLKKFASGKSKDWKDYNTQLEFAWSEWTGSECSAGLKSQGGLDNFKKLTDPEKAADVWRIAFERCGEQGASARRKYAKEFYEKFKNYTPPSNSSSGSNNDAVHGWPLPSNCTYISSKFGVSRDNGRTHKGLDIAVPEKTPVYAYKAGTAVTVSKDSSRGNYIKLDHGGGTYTWYLHLSSFKVKQGDKVNSGQTIGLTGNTGHSTGPHLHFEMWVNNVAVDPLKYVKVGGGAKTLSVFSIKEVPNKKVFKTMDIADNEITYENIDRSKICFASYDNKQHTYIDRALFNNESPKYTVSIGAFFDDESTELERDGNITDSDKGWPRTEKKLIQQCAQALYFEGFTADNLWREFDLNRAPSPFLYLDREKWKAFLVEVDKQVDWLNNKYGKVTATYVPYNLLTNMNLNQFIEMSPDLGIKQGTLSNVSNTDDTSNSSSTDTVDSLDGGTFIGDSRTEALDKEMDLLKGIDVFSKIGASANYFYSKKHGSPVNRLTSLKKDTKYTFVWLGINNPSAYSSTIDLLEYLKKTVKNKIFVLKELKVPNNCSTCGLKPSDFNSKLETYNKKVQDYCSSNSINFVDISSSVKDDMYANTLAGKDIHFTPSGYKAVFEAIKSALIGSTDEDKKDDDKKDDNSKNKDTITTGNLSTGNEVFKSTSFNDEEIKFEILVDDKDANKDYKGKYCFVICDTNAYMYKEADTASKKVKKCVYGDELKIIGSKKIFYEVSFDDATGYIRAKNVNVITTKKYGNADKENIGKTCWILFDNTDVYKKIGDKEYKLVDQQKEGVISDAKDDYYFIKFKKDNNIEEDTKKDNTKNKDIVEEGWVKAYRVTLNKKSFKEEEDNTERPIGNITEIELKNPDFETYNQSDVTGDTNTTDNTSNTETNDTNNTETGDNTNNKDTNKKNNTDASKVSINDINTSDTDTDDTSDTGGTTINPTDVLDPETLKEGWEEEGNVIFTIVKNKDIVDKGRFTYRGNYFARIQNESKKLSGIKQSIKIEKVTSTKTGKESNEFTIRISCWLKQVTFNDDPSGVIESSIDQYLQNGITYYILDKNEKVVSSTKVEIPNDVTKFGRKTALFTGIKPGDYTFLIGSKNNFDIYVDDFLIEQIYDYDMTIGDYTTTGNIGTASVGNTTFDNGGLMFYSQEKPKTSASKNPPDIETIITQDEYDDIMKNSNLTLIDNYTNSFEPYDKGLKEILDSPILEDDRLNTLTEKINTFTGNMIRYAVVEAGPGSVDHCVKPADELNVLYKQVDVNVEPIYPDLIIPPNYSTGDYDTNSKNSLPLCSMQDGILQSKDTLNKQFSFDYEQLNEKEKKSKGFPLNYNDAYCFDDKITELEKHYPKIKIDEIESRVYSCNHPGCPIGQPLAKNFAMLNDMQLAQSKRIEQRMVRIENILSTMVRNIGRLGSRMNINCVYYGGQNIFNKYKTIRCLHDDRVHDGCSVTIEQCMCCTRYEPIIGQIYDILDSNGFNGSTILDDMQMSYMTLDDFKNLNKIERRNSKFKYIDSNKEEKDEPKTLISKWDEENLDKYTKELKKDKDSKDIEKKLKNVQKSDYSFIMDWSLQEVDTQNSDVKPYPSEGITAKYYVDKKDNAETDEKDEKVDKKLDKKLDKDTIDNLNNIKFITNGTWVDTREKADTTQSNKYTSEDFYFENFNLNRTGYEYDNGLKGYIGLDIQQSSTTGAVSNSVSGSGSECRNKIVEWAKKVREQHLKGEAQYLEGGGTKDPDHLKRYKGTYLGTKNPILYDCSSLSSTCYKYAGLTSMYNKTCSGGDIMKEIVNNGGKMWLANEEGMKDALPGDCIVKCANGYHPTQADMTARKKLSITHIMIYIGDGKIIHASQPKPSPKGIREDTWDKSHYNWGISFFIRPKDLIEADKVSSSTGLSNGSGVTEKSGTIDGNNYVCILEKCRLTAYGTWDGSSNRTATGKSLSGNPNKMVASHNMPYGTQVYIPLLKGKVNSTGIFTVEDTGGYCFDFDVCTSSGKGVDSFSGKSAKVYVLKWGSGSVAISFTQAIGSKGISSRYRTAWNSLKKDGGSTMELLKFRKDDANIKNKSWY